MKLKKKELDNLKALVEKMSTKQNEIGLNTINGHKLAHAFSQLEIELNTMKTGLEEIYGKCNINVETGEIDKIESNETNKKD
jgi:hypothetical protein|tara:strand:- start:560 stop:805 length:246 start_codon:yes stop_codon:yes gene_type:complete